MKDGCGWYFPGHVSAKRNNVTIQNKWKNALLHQQNICLLLARNNSLKVLFLIHYIYKFKMIIIGALKIALEAKLKKQALYSKEGELELQVQTLNTMKKNLKTLDRYPATIANSEAILRYLDEKLLNKKKKSVGESNYKI